ncbi:specificity protein phosphatase [Seminavis robusta]|uniref:protein-tyrosine-phosphatase n=1 Tax=Seminavis robusta TaxID=568900 RepID=A0A9N8HQI7_9STRA|nr:specificity protein phosphatase [Seminavis robusta]|eukprot:Sro988_g228430.1 specificity protein phosphatase (609) ;mRNA; f:30562-32388
MSSEEKDIPPNHKPENSNSKLTMLTLNMEQPKKPSSLLAAALKTASPQFAHDLARNRQLETPRAPMVTSPLQARRAVEERLPPATLHPRISIIGSVDFYNDESPALCDAIGKALARRVPDCCLMTGANSITQEKTALAFKKELESKQRSPRIFHLAPEGFQCDWEFGTHLTAGRSMEERRFLLATLADICISIEGGPGTVDEMEQALQAGKIIIPLGRTGGASNGMFGAPTAPRPSCVEESTWKLLFDTGASIQSSADAVVSIVEAILEGNHPKNNHKTPRLAQDAVEVLGEAIADAVGVTYTKRPTVSKDSPAYVEPTLSGCAHRVFRGSNHVTSGDSLGDIYLGPKSAAGRSALSDLQAANIGGIVNCTNTFPCYHQAGGIQYCTVAVNDECGADILTFLDGATNFLNMVLSRGASALVHCEMGVSRSSTVVMAYLIRFRNMTRDEAYLHIKARRPQASPNPGFWEQLNQFEKRCRGGNDGAPEEGGAVFDADWAKTSNAAFATCRETPEVLRANQAHRRLQDTSSEDHEQLLSVCLDFVWGRGVLDIDLDWLSFLCDELDQRNDRGWSASTVRGILFDHNSEFSGIWAGEVYEHQIQKVLRKLEG